MKKIVLSLCVMFVSSSIIYAQTAEPTQKTTAQKSVTLQAVDASAVTTDFSITSVPGQLVIRAYPAKATRLGAQLIDGAGKVVYTLPPITVSSRYIQTINMQDFPSGTYRVVLINGTHTDELTFNQ